MKASADYWRERAEANMDAAQDMAAARLKRIGRAYRQAEAGLNGQVEKIIGRYAGRMGLSREEAERYLRAPFDENSRAYGYRMTRAEALRKAAQEQAEKLERKLRGEMDAQWSSAASESARRAEKLTAGISFTSPNMGGVRRALDMRWSGASYSQRIWANTRQLAELLDKEITAAFMSGKTNAAIARTVAERFQVSFAQAERLVRTETSYVENQAAIARYADAGCEEVEFLTARDSRTCPVCAGHNGARVKIAEARAGENVPPLHPWCRCTVVAVVEDAQQHQSGAPSGAKKTTGWQDRHAERYYEEIRRRRAGVDASKIALYTPFTPKAVEEIRQHMFIREQPLDDGRTMARFAPSFRQAQAWQRLTEGRGDEIDLLMLKHEYYELTQMRLHGYNYDEAHKLANSKYNWWNAEKKKRPEGGED